MKKPWESEKVWLAIVGIGAVVGLSALGAINDLSASHVIALVGALVLGRAWEGAAAAKR
jgi:hypothetical protein